MGYIHGGARRIKFIETKMHTELIAYVAIKLDMLLAFIVPTMSSGDE